ncbi:MAG: PEP-CTERM sorting domain-containing protein [Tistlia sp.]|uniref:PEP-CTERM sorting domain-containing protein n=1 Tax=Tistlia sp. TaxID=3057121 RepID=UPI0034A4111A
MERMRPIVAALAAAASLMVAAPLTHAAAIGAVYGSGFSVFPWVAQIGTDPDDYVSDHDVFDYLSMSFVDVAVTQHKREVGDATSGSEYYGEVGPSGASYHIDAWSIVDGVGYAESSIAIEFTLAITNVSDITIGFYYFSTFYSAFPPGAFGLSGAYVNDVGREIAFFESSLRDTSEHSPDAFIGDFHTCRTDSPPGHYYVDDRNPPTLYCAPQSPDHSELWIYGLGLAPGESRYVSGELRITTWARAVPEPGSWFMMLSATAVVPMLLLRRRRRQMLGA